MNVTGIRECQDGEGGPGNPSTLEVGAGESEPRSALAIDFEHCLSFVGPGLKHTNKKRGAVPQVLRRAEAKVQEGYGREMWLGSGGLGSGRCCVRRQPATRKCHSRHTHQTLVVSARRCCQGRGGAGCALQSVPLASSSLLLHAMGHSSQNVSKMHSYMFECVCLCVCVCTCMLYKLCSQPQ